MVGDREKTRGRPGRKPLKDAASSSVQVLDRSLRLLELVAEGDGAVLSELAEQSGMATSTVHRLLNSLAQHGMVAHDGETGAWTVGVKAFEIGTAYMRFRKLGTISRPFLKQLMGACGETANIAIEEDGDVVFISQVESHAPMRAFFRPGRRGPIHASGIGKAILSTWPDKQIEALLSGRSLERFTDKTRDSLALLLQDISGIRLRGWSIDDEEHTLGMRCVAAPIFDEYGEAVAGISVSGPAVRMPDNKLEAVGPLVLAAAKGLTKAMGGRSRPLLSIDVASQG
ncbi:MULTISPECIES: HTH-type transcriptional regulator BhcR [unclassified Rhizobium]|uniref:HTH-type transcriptional regulator BhcR n=1 Tax=unclassified Rhizobium TaxID=2613769 RepID=UPI001618D90A|nr:MULTISPECIES: HTH-type transcriptional regulator BhcR [unclassified Rhizobium]MBB3317478.1 IclR family acetate operon transcriptional repressor [Rhizobium sp. BK181]MBB3543217.1 IclR family acetate operon transcriptional repressor [Rhizobium sp. BK399]MCS3741771.1 IclR family acetate operon transcriptional repressor [Rhizobium sp. BK661]MCS4093502.1 IclR family acetate operon transcriptional repressor [Rhizobium sp. BK176]